MDGEKEKLKRNRYNRFYMDLAERTAQMSYAKRLQVGSILVKNDNIISFGWNGMPTGWDNNCEETEYILKSECQFDSEDMIALGYTETDNGWMKNWSKPEVLHSEANCLMKLAKSTNSSEDASLFVTHAPCLNCAKSIYQAGITSVFYRDTYKDPAGVEFLKKCGVYVEQIKSV